ncbi:16S rRNA (guanine(527)-N(7))-methyltransferase RsmG [Thiotrichales bacterium 19S9-12]|nr:16S rRNA (guanine(527)-N(7))-methyltransferase RsmG [Thiotrichales bacterium 19S9-11]MCF6811528.1 16S rRNA (guanine(527)-N(7))-methyltransferase RsmG [Thiotrichales bacterium 19S9-12]
MIEAAINSLGLKATLNQIDKFKQYIDLLEKWNKAYNLSAIRNKAQMYPYHLYDSLVIAPYIKNKQVIDVGSGAGLPGIPLAVLFPEKSFTLLDSNIKKSRFQRQVALELQLENIEIIHSRVEEHIPSEQYDYVISRAFSSLAQMYQWCNHLIKDNGLFLAMKGQSPTFEINELQEKYHITPKITELQVPELSAQRHLASFKKK